MSLTKFRWYPKPFKERKVLTPPLWWELGCGSSCSHISCRKQHIMFALPNVLPKDIKHHISDYLVFPHARKKPVKAVKVQPCMNSGLTTNSSENCWFHSAYAGLCDTVTSPVILDEFTNVTFESLTQQFPENPSLQHLNDLFSAYMVRVMFIETPMLFDDYPVYLVSDDFPSLDNGKHFLTLPCFNIKLEHNTNKFGHLVHTGNSSIKNQSWINMLDVHNLVGDAFYRQLGAETASLADISLPMQLSVSRTLTESSWKVLGDDYKCCRVSKEMRLALNGLTHSHYNQHWLAVNGTLYKCAKGDPPSSLLDPWNDIYFVPSSTHEAWKWPIFRHAIWFGILNLAYNTVDVSTEELTVDYQYLQMIAAISGTNYQQFMNEDFAENIFPQTSAHDFIHPFLKLWQQLTLTPDLQCVSENKAMMTTEHAEIEQMLQYTVVVNNLAQKFMEENDVLWCELDDLNLPVWQLDDFKLPDMLEGYSELALETIYRKHWFDRVDITEMLLEHESWIKYSITSNVTKLNLKRLWLILGVNKPECSMSMMKLQLSPVDITDVWGKITSFWNSVPTRYTAIAKDAMEYYGTDPTESLSGHFRNTELLDLMLKHIQFVEQQPPGCTLILADLLVSMQVLSRLTVLQQTTPTMSVPNFEAVFSSTKSVFNTKLLQDAQHYWSQGTTNSKKRSFDYILKFTGSLFEQFFEMRTGLQPAPFDHSMREVLDRMAVDVGNEGGFDCNTRCPNVDFVSSKAMFELIYAGNADEQEKFVNDKVERISQTCMSHGFTMPTFVVLASRRISEWNHLIESHQHLYDEPVKRSPLEYLKLVALEQDLKECKQAVFSSLTHEQQQQVKVGIQFAHSWQSRHNAIPTETVDIDKYAQKLVSMCSREQEMWNLDSPGLHCDANGPNFKNLVQNITWSGPFSNERATTMTTWDNKFCKTFSDKMFDVVANGTVSSCVKQTVHTINKEQVAMFFCSNHNETKEQQLIRLKADRFATILERTRMVKLKTTPNNFGSVLADELNEMRKTDNEPDDRIDFIVKIPTGVVQRNKIKVIVSPVTALSSSKDMEMLEQCRKHAHKSEIGSQLANFVRQCQMRMSCSVGLPVSVYDATHCALFCTSQDLTKLNLLLNKRQEQSFNAAYEKLCKPKKGRTFTELEAADKEFPVHWHDNADQLRRITEKPTFNAYEECVKYKDFWNIMEHCVREFDSIKYMDQTTRNTTLIERKHESHDPNYDPHYPYIPTRVDELISVVEELEQTIHDPDLVRRALNLTMNQKLITQAEEYLKVRGYGATNVLPIANRILQHLCTKRGFLYAVHMLDVAEQVKHVMSTRVGDATLAIRSCELTGMQMVVNVKSHHGSWCCDVILLSDTLPGAGTTLGPTRCSFTHVDWKTISQVNMWASYKFQITDVHVEQYSAVVAYAIDNVMTELQLQNLLSQPRLNFDDPDVQHVICSNVGIWMLESARMQKMEGSFFLGARYLLMNMFGIMHHDELGEKVSHVPRTTFEHYAMDVMTNNLPKFDNIVRNKEKFGAGTQQVLEKLLNKVAIGDQELAELTNSHELWDFPLFFSSGTAKTASMSIYEVFKGYQQTRHELDARTAKLTVGNKIQETVFKVATKRMTNSHSCSGEPAELWGLRGYTKTNNDEEARTIEQVTAEQVKSWMSEPNHDRSIEHESNLALYLATGQLSLPSCCATLTSMGSKLLNTDVFTAPNVVLKTVAFAESQTEMIKSTSRNHAPLYDVGTLESLRLTAVKLKATKIVRTMKNPSIESINEALSSHSIDITHPTTQRFLVRLCMEMTDKIPEIAKLWPKLLSNEFISHTVDERLAVLHTMSRWVDQTGCKAQRVQELKDVIHSELEGINLQALIFETRDSDDVPILMNRLNEAVQQSNTKQFPNFGLHLSMLFVLLDPICETTGQDAHLADIEKFLRKTTVRNEQTWQTMFKEVLGTHLDLNDEHEIAALSMYMYSPIPLDVQMDLVMTRTVECLETVMEITLHVMPFIKRKSCVNSANITAMFYIQRQNLKTMMRKTRRSRGDQSFKLPTSKRMHKGISIALDMLSSSLITGGRYETKLDRAIESFYSSYKMTFGRSFKEQLEKPRELPVKDKIADTKTDFVERVSQSALSQIACDAVANPHLKKKIQRSMSSRVLKSLQVASAGMTVKIRDKDGNTFSDFTRMTWLAILGNLDHSAWGPNHAPGFFAWQYAPREKAFTPLIATICSMFCFEGSQKDDEIIPDMWHAWVNKTFKRDLLPVHVRPLFDYFIKHLKAAKPNAFDMGQGMYHVTSSDNSQCVCKIRHHLMHMIAGKFGLNLRLTDQQGSDDRHALWEILGMLDTLLTKSQLQQLRDDYQQQSLNFGEHASDIAFSSNFQKGMQCVVIALDNMLSWSMNYKLSPKSANGSISEMNSHFENAGREINPLVRETAPICKFQPIGTHFESETQLIQLCRSGYDCGSTELTVMTLQLHKLTRLRKFYGFDNCAAHNFLQCSNSGHAVSPFLLPLNMGGSVLSVSNEVMLGSIQQVEESKLQFWNNTTSRTGRWITQVQKQMYKRIATALPDEDDDMYWGVETIPKSQMVRRGIKQRMAKDQLKQLIFDNKDLRTAALHQANSKESLLEKLDVLTQGVTATSSKIGELQRLESMLVKAMQEHVNPSIATKLQDAARAARSYCFKANDIDVRNPSFGEWRAMIPTFFYGTSMPSELIRMSNISETSGKLTTQHNFYFLWLIEGLRDCDFPLPMPAHDSLMETSAIERSKCGPGYEQCVPMLSTVSLHNSIKSNMLTHSPMRLMLDNLEPRLLSYKGIGMIRNSSYENDQKLMKVLCKTELENNIQIRHEVDGGNITEDHIKQFESNAISIWQKTKNFVAERVEVSLNVPGQMDPDDMTLMQKISSIVRQSLIRGRRYNKMDGVTHVQYDSSTIKLHNDLSNQNTIMKEMLQVSCMTKQTPNTVCQKLLQMESATKATWIEALAPIPSNKTLPPTLRMIQDENEVMRHLLSGTPAPPVNVQGTKVYIESSYVKTEYGFRFTATATCHRTRVYVTSNDFYMTWRVVNPLDDHIRLCIARINIAFNNYSAETRVPIFTDVLNNELHNSHPQHQCEITVNPLDPTKEPNKHNNLKIRYQIISEQISPVYSSTTIDNPVYELDAENRNIVLLEHQKCSNVAINTSLGRMTVKDINDELQKVNRTTSESDPDKALLKYVVAMTEPNKVVRVKTAIMSLDTHVNVSNIIDMITVATSSNNPMLGDQFRSMLNLCCQMITAQTEENIVKNLARQTWNDDTIDLVSAAAIKAFPFKNEHVSVQVKLTDRDPFQPEPPPDTSWMDNVTKPILTGLISIVPHVYNQVRFLESWEQPTTLEDIHDPMHHLPELCDRPPPFTVSNICSLKQQVALYELPEVPHMILMFPFVSLIQRLSSKLAAQSMYFKLRVLHQHFVMTWSDVPWQRPIILVLTSMINAYTDEQIASEGVTMIKRKRPLPDGSREYRMRHNSFDVLLRTDVSKHSEVTQIVDTTFMINASASIMTLLVKYNAIHLREQKPSYDEDEWE